MDLKAGDRNDILQVIAYVASYWGSITLFSIIIRKIIFLAAARVDSGAVDGGSCTPADRQAAVGDRQEVKSESRLVLALLDALATFELCACSQECWPVRSAAGMPGLLVAIACNIVRGALMTFRDAYGSPCNPWYRFLTGETSATWLGITWLLQLLAASLSARVSQLWWSFQWTQHHAARHRLAQLSDSSRRQLPAELQVSMLSGLSIECLGTLVDLYSALLAVHLLNRWSLRRGRPGRGCSGTDDEQTARGGAAASTMTCSASLQSSSRRLGDQLLAAGTVSANSVKATGDSLRHDLLLPDLIVFLVRLLVNMTVVAKCINLTGIYLNPANAFVQSWGVGDVTVTSHLLVYWVGPFLGVWLALQAERLSLRLLVT